MLANDSSVIETCLSAVRMRMINYSHFLARFEILKALLIKIPFFWDMTPCILQYTFQHFSGACWVRLQVSVSPETLINSSWTLSGYCCLHMLPFTWIHISEGWKFYFLDSITLSRLIRFRFTCKQLQSSSHSLKLGGWGSGERRRKMEAQGMRPVPVVWH